MQNSSFQRWSVARAALINDLSNTRPSFACTHSHASTFTLAAFGAVAKECASGIITILPWESFIQLTARLLGSALEENQHPLRSRFSYFCNSGFVSCVFIDYVSALNLLQTVMYTCRHIYIYMLRMIYRFFEWLHTTIKNFEHVHKKYTCFFKTGIEII